jgi:hypothetical protein
MAIDSTGVSGPVLDGFFGTPTETGCTLVFRLPLSRPYLSENAWQNPRKLHAEGT